MKKRMVGYFDNEPKRHEVSWSVLATLHFTVHDAGIVPFSINVVHLSLNQPVENLGWNLRTSVTNLDWVR